MRQTLWASYRYNEVLDQADKLGLNKLASWNHLMVSLSL